MEKKYFYNDGDEIENYLFNLFKRNPTDEEVEEILKLNPPWAIKYHLSKDRENLLSWYNFHNNSRILEIGAGCGAITGTLLRKESEVVAVELTKRRADIIKERFKKYNNLKVFAGNLHELEFDNRFDFITLIGVLEYAGRFTTGTTPFKTMLETTKNLLNKNGVLIIGIENKYGLKYWRGAPEDHTGKLFDSIEGYPEFDGIRTFSRYEILSLLESAGFKRKNVTFYYPIPDYKFCYEIFSDHNLPNIGHHIANNLFPSPHPIQSFNLFDESLASRELQDNEMFNFFSNSFLIFVNND